MSDMSNMSNMYNMCNYLQNTKHPHKTTILIL